eukprot:GEMP01032219.1.p1 GENE.GEMP01032219.1~~GEMP01032219.1.p1  ORF type:complete len:345 (+),score=58.60 GEMP01032219.1:91-1125(+)
MFILQKITQACTYQAKKEEEGCYVQAPMNLFPSSVPGLSDTTLEALRHQTSPFKQIEVLLSDVNAEVSRQQGLAKLYKRGMSQNLLKNLQPKVREVVETDLYTDAFVTEFQGEEFIIVSEEICPNHSIEFVLRVNGGGSYWTAISADDTQQFRVEVLGVNKEATNLNLSLGAIRGVTIGWRWRQSMDLSYADIPRVIDTALSWDGHDPLAKLRSMHHHIEVWQTEMESRIAEFIKAASHERTGAAHIEDYLKYVFRNWPSKPNPDGSGREQLRKCTWIEGADPSLFCNRKVIITAQNCKYLEDFSYTLRAIIVKTKPMVEEKSMQGHDDPPFRLDTQWSWQRRN